MRKLFVALLLCAALNAQEISIQTDDESVAAEEAAFDAATTQNERATNDVRAFAQKVGSTDAGLLYNSRFVGPRRLRTYLNPIRYDDNGVPKPIDTRWRNVSGVHPNYSFACLSNNVIIGLDVNGWRHLKGSGFHLRSRPESVRIGANVYTTSETTFPVRRVNADRIRIDGLWPQGIPSFYQITKSGVKEGLLLPASLQSAVPVGATWVRFRYEYERLSGAMTAELDADATSIRIIDNSEIVAIMPRPWAQDSAGARSYGAYQLGAGWLEVAIDAAWLRDAARQWPILVDPTVTAASTSTQNAIESTSGSPDDPYHHYFQIDLPDIGAGATFVAADFVAYLTSSSGASWTIEIWTSSGTGWTNASNFATLTGLTTFDSNVGIDFTSETVGWKTWADIHGTTANAQTIASAYDASTNPSNWTIVMHSDIGAGTNAPADDVTQIYFSRDNDTDQAQFGTVGGANEPYIEIEYTGGASSSTYYGSGSAGTLMVHNEETNDWRKNNETLFPVLFGGDACCKFGRRACAERPQRTTAFAYAGVADCGWSALASHNRVPQRRVCWIDQSRPPAIEQRHASPAGRHYAERGAQRIEY